MPLAVEVDETASQVIVRILISDINETFKSKVFAARVAQGDITVRMGTRLTSIATNAFFTPWDLSERVPYEASDYANAPHDSYWAIGD